MAEAPLASANAGGLTTWVVLGALTLVAAALRLPFLGQQSLWLDEVVTRGIIAEPSLIGVWNHVQATESTPPLFYVLEWLFGGQSAVTMRVLPAVALIAAVPVSYFSVRRLVGGWAALATAAIVAVTPELVEYSMDARAYGLFVLTALLSLWGFACVLEGASRRRYLGWAAGSVACVWTHYFGFFLVGAEAIVLFFAVEDARRSTVAWSFAIAVCVAPLLPLVLRQNGDERAEFITGIPLSSRIATTVRQFAMGADVPRTWLEGAGLALALGGLAVGALLAVRSAGRSRHLLVLTALAFAAPLALAVLKIEDRFYDRNMLFLVPLVAALAAPALLRARALPLIVYLSLAVLASVWVASNWRYEQVDWRTAATRMRSIDPAAAVLVVPQSRYSLVPARLYLGQVPKTTTVVARNAWIAVEPYRAAHHRALGPAPLPAPLGTGIPGFRTLRSLNVHGFRLLLEQASRPSPINPQQIAGTAVFGPPV